MTYIIWVAKSGNFVNSSKILITLPILDVGIKCRGFSFNTKLLKEQVDK